MCHPETDYCVSIMNQSFHIEFRQHMRALTRSERIVLKTLCWSIVIGFTALTGLFGLGIHHLFAESAKPSSLGWCGNSVTDPLGAILSFGTPLSIAAVIPLGVLWRRGMARGWSVATAAALALICTITLVIFGVHFFRDSLAGVDHLSNNVWWLRPIGSLVGI